jgi:hypothetical protein
MRDFFPGSESWASLSFGRRVPSVIKPSNTMGLTDQRLIERFDKIASTALCVGYRAARAELNKLNKELSPENRIVTWVVSGQWHSFELVDTVTARTLVKWPPRRAQPH